jgi:hypothetical protein
MELTARMAAEYRPHPEGIHNAVCVDVIDLGMMKSEHQGRTKMVRKVRVVFETGELKDDGTPFTLVRTYTASLHPKARLAQCIEKWRGRPLAENEVLDLRKLIGASAVLLISHNKRPDGSTGATIDAITKPVTKVTPSSKYNPVAAREKLAAWRGEGTATAPAAPVAGEIHGAEEDESLAHF